MKRLLKKYGNPGEQYGYPAFLILSAKGEVLFTQKSEDLEDGKGYDPKKSKEIPTRKVVN